MEVRMIRKEELHDSLPRFMHKRGIRLDHHPRSTRHRTARNYKSQSHHKTCPTRLRRPFHFNQTHATIPRNIQLVMITIPTINAHPRHSPSPYLGICTPANSQAWMSAAPCSTRIFLPSIVISISARTDAEAEKGRCGGIAWPAVPRRTAPTARRRNIVPAAQLMARRWR